MRRLTDLRDKAINQSLNTVLPIYAKVADKVGDIADTPVGRVVVGTAGKGLELASPVVDRVVPVVEKVLGVEEPKQTVTDADKAPVAKTGTRQTVTKSATKTPANKTATKKTATKKAATPNVSKKRAREAELAKRPVVEKPAIEGKDNAVAPAPMVQDVPAATDLPVAGYESLAPEVIVGKVDTLTNTELAQLIAYERSNANRVDVIGPLEGGIVALALPTYDSLADGAIIDALETLSPDDLRTIRAYEVRTRNRLPIVERIDHLLT